MHISRLFSPRSTLKLQQFFFFFLKKNVCVNSIGVIYPGIISKIYHYTKEPQIVLLNFIFIHYFIQHFYVIITKIIRDQVCIHFINYMTIVIVLEIFLTWNAF